MSIAELASDVDDAPPEGFQRLNFGEGFATRNACFYGRWEGDRVRLGFRVTPRLTNLRGGLHGGMLATFADMLLPYTIMTCGLGERRFLPTINLQIDYVAPAGVGDWIEGEAEVLRVTRSLAFAQGRITANDKLIARVSGIFRLGDAFPGAAEDAQLFAPPVKR